MDYWDSSALAKLYVPEPDSVRFVLQLSVGGSFMTSELARWELFRVLARKEKEGALPAGATGRTFAAFLSAAGLGEIVLRTMDDSVEARFRSLVLELIRRPQPVLIRTFDGIHLATASLWKATTFVASDHGLRRAAAAAGFALFPSEEENS
jgi:predicted nucleic acid-binding protein